LVSGFSSNTGGGLTQNRWPATVANFSVHTLPDLSGIANIFYPVGGSKIGSFSVISGWRYMPAKSKKQQMAAGAALATKRGKRSKSLLKGASRKMYKSMTKKQPRDIANTKRKRLPTRKRKKKR
jgi:hypothetical protein